MNPDTGDMRRHPRYTVREPCRVIIESREYTGAVVDISVSGAAVHLDVELEAEPEIGTIIELDVERIGTIRTRVVRPLIGGIAVEMIAGRIKLYLLPSIGLGFANTRKAPRVKST